VHCNSVNAAISAHEISFVVQGPIVSIGPNSTKFALESIRTHFPSAEIILSTWEGENCGGLIFDILLLNIDPGFFVRKDGLKVNINRQIVSTYNGILKATRTYVVKMRTDILLQNNKLLSCYSVKARGLVFAKKLLTINLFSRDPLKIPLLFHPSDIFILGLREDVEKLFSCQQAPEYLVAPIDNSGLIPEQYLWMNCLIRHGILKYYLLRELIKPSDFRLSDSTFFGNFILFDYHNIGLTLPDNLINGWHPELVYDEKLQRLLNVPILQKAVLDLRYLSVVLKSLYSRLLSILYKVCRRFRQNLAVMSNKRNK